MGVIGLVVAVGGVAAVPCFVFMFLRGHTEPNRHGPPPTTLLGGKTTAD